MYEQIRNRLSDYAPQQLALDYPEAAILVPVVDCGGEPGLILTQRAAHLKTHRGQVAFPGGKRDSGDASLEHTALRETHEEIGLPGASVSVAGRLSQVMSLHRILVTPYVGVVEGKPELQANPGEIDSIFTVPISFFMEDDRLRTDTLGFQDHTLYVPCYQWGQYHIWGLSAVVLVDFLNAVYGAGIDLLEPPHE
ncbi:8-oxo-dGTP pyrophosphatase MutT (NUDIX family) [Tamilnaduibacter salinus]|uniref:8-oxo-dGTP pyrophosphatase MutT (NUDIX family) n=1 Tax=Tamilnaduibacter salinus TaxID=1484056 RepID=A0A2U1D1P6_9GAMM|nr:CoA pyrophosphatase [Tamilnaduibacter salinus]PVY79313.1 8-oxo-dGTP pyrophosphatase MutT (NUDIX family) [Tamilnaduibacter salinus]